MEYHDECLDTLCDYEPELEEEGTKVSVPTRKKRRGGVMSADTHLLEIDEDEDEDEENMTSNTIFMHGGTGNVLKKDNNTVFDAHT